MAYLQRAFLVEEQRTSCGAAERRDLPNFEGVCVRCHCRISLYKRDGIWEQARFGYAWGSSRFEGCRSKGLGLREGALVKEDG